METTFRLTKEHTKLRRKYYLELLLFLLLLLLVPFVLLTLETFSVTAFFTAPSAIIIASIIFGLYIIFGGIYFPLRAKALQKRLLINFFNVIKSEKIMLLPNPKGGQNFDYKTLLDGSGIHISSRFDVLSRYEFMGRLVHVLHYKKAGNQAVIIHVPALDSPYYMQINNGAFTPPTKYYDSDIVNVTFVSENRLNYYATAGPGTVKMYLRKYLEAKFKRLLEVEKRTFQYIATYSDEFLYIDKYTIANELCLTTKYSENYYKTLIKQLKLIQSLMIIMMEKGR